MLQPVDTFHSVDDHQAVDAHQAEWPDVDFGSQSAVIPTIPPNVALSAETGQSAAPPGSAAAAAGGADVLPPPDASPLVATITVRRRNRLRTQAMIALLLTAILIVLVFVLVWVLGRKPAETKRPVDKAAKCAPDRLAPVSLALAKSDSLTRKTLL